MYPYFFIDYYYIILVIPAMLFGIFAQAKVSSTFAKYKAIRSANGQTAADVARKMLDNHGLTHVSVVHIGGNLTDNFNPQTNTVNLSSSVYSSSSIASIGVAAHEVGHAIQYADGYLPIKIRNTFVPIANLGSTLGIPLIIFGLIIDITQLISIGLVVFSTVAIFQFVTLPVEFNASRRAIDTLESDGYLRANELEGAKKVLGAAALTYVAALVMSVAQLLRLFLLYGGRGRRD